MVDIVYRAAKGSPLSFQEVDENFSSMLQALQAGTGANVTVGGNQPTSPNEGDIWLNGDPPTSIHIYVGNRWFFKAFDGTAPTLSIDSAVTISDGTDGEYTSAVINYTVSDNVTPSGEINISAVSNGVELEVVGIDTQNNQIDIRSDDFDATRSFTVTVTATDGAGNQATANCIVTLEEQQLYYFALTSTEIPLVPTNSTSRNFVHSGKTFTLYDDASTYTITNETINGTSVKALNFAGLSGLFIHPHPFPYLLSSTKDFYVEWWQYGIGGNTTGSDSYGGDYGAVLNYPNNTSRSRHIMLHYGGTIYWTSPSGSDTTGTHFANNEWHHIYLEWKDGAFKIYNDGVFNVQKVASGRNFNGAAQADIGGFQWGSRVGGTSGQTFKLASFVCSETPLYDTSSSFTPVPK